MKLRRFIAKVGQIHQRQIYRERHTTRKQQKSPVHTEAAPSLKFHLSAFFKPNPKSIKGSTFAPELMRSALYRIDLEDEEANYTIGQLVTHLKLPGDFSDYEKVEKLLRRREERVKEEVRRETEEVVVRRFEGWYEEAVKWKVMVKESVMKFEEDVRVLRERYDELRKQKDVMDERVRALGLLSSNGNVELMKRKLSLGEVKVEVGEGFQKVVNEKSDLVVENVRLRNEARECKEMAAAFKMGANVEKCRFMEMERLKKLEKDIEVLKNQCKCLTEENVKLIKEVKASRLMNEDLRKREDEANVRVSELEIQLKNEAGLRVRAEKNHEALERKFQDLVDENLKLRKDVGEWRKTYKDLRKQEHELKVRVWELEREVETEESLRRWAEEALEALELKFQELEVRISVTKKDASMFVAGYAESDCFRKGKVTRRTNSVEAGGSSKQVNLVDLTEVAQAGNFMEGPVNGTEISSARQQQPADIVYISDSEDDSCESEAPLIFKRKRPRLQNL